MNDQCPVCGLKAKFETPTGDYSRIVCPRCGAYEITGTAVAMLENRLNGKEKSVARLSHAIRSHSSRSRWFKIDSTNLDELVSKRLPGIKQQIGILVQWIADQVDDDEIQPIELPQDSSVLAGILGAINASRVDDIVELAGRQGLIDFVSDSHIQLTPEGIGFLRSSDNNQYFNEASDSNSKHPAIQPKLKHEHGIILADCPDCEGKRNSRVVAHYHKRSIDDQGLGIFADDTYRILECCGCDKIFVQHEHVFSERESARQNQTTGEWEIFLEPTFEYWPKATSRTKPGWLLLVKDNSIHRLFDEVYGAIQEDFRTIAAMGIRTIIDRTLVLAIVLDAVG